MKNLPIEVLRAFVTIVELGSFTQAGDLLGRSQPAISLQMKRLEDLLEQKLISRNGQHIELTKMGEQLFYYAKRILSLNDEAIASFGATNVSGQLKLGIPNEFATTLLPKILSRFANTYPNVNLEVVSDLSRNLVNEGPQKLYDIKLLLHDDPRKVGSALMKEDELVWVSSHNHDCHSRSILPLIVAPEGCIYRNRATSQLAEAGLPWKISYTNPSLSGIQAAIEEGLGITVLAKSSVPKGLKVISNSTRLPKLGRIGISLVNQCSEQSEAAQRLSEYISASLS